MIETLAPPPGWKGRRFAARQRRRRHSHAIRRESHRDRDPAEALPASRSGGLPRAEAPAFTEIENLFATPIPKMRIDHENEWLAHVADAVEARQIHSGAGTPLPNSLFPMEVEDTTPGKLLAEYERQSGKPVYFDDDTFELTKQPPPGLVEKIREWWRSTGITVLRP